MCVWVYIYRYVNMLLCRASGSIYGMCTGMRTHELVHVPKQRDYEILYIY